MIATAPHPVDGAPHVIVVVLIVTETAHVIGRVTVPNRAIAPVVTDPRFGDRTRARARGVMCAVRALI